jgi:hypothetical protein
MKLAFYFALRLAIGPISASCEEYEPPPGASLEGLSSGALDLADPRGPLVVDFGMPIDPSTLFVKVALFEPDAEGNLGDEDADPNTELHVLVRHDGEGHDLGARAELDPDRSKLRLLLDQSLPTDVPLVLLVEGGLRGGGGGPNDRVTRDRQRIRFSSTKVLDASIAE